MNPQPKPHHPAATVMSPSEIQRSAITTTERMTSKSKSSTSNHLLHHSSPGTTYTNSTSTTTTTTMTTISPSTKSAFQEITTTLGTSTTTSSSKRATTTAASSSRTTFLPTKGSTTTRTHIHTHGTHLSRIQIEQINGTECEAKVATNPSSSIPSSQEQYDRTMKVAKKEYSDHGSHGVIVKSTLLKKMTTSLQDVYDDSTNELITKCNSYDSKIVSSPTTTLPPHHASSSSSSSSSLRHGKKRLSPTRDVISPSSSSNGGYNTSSSKNHSLLHAALQEENAKQQDTTTASATTTTSSHYNTANTTNTTPPNINTTNTNAQVRNKCLTNPNKPTSNDGLDNIEGNLIVYENDLIQVPNRNIHLHQNGSCSSHGKHSKPHKRKESTTHPNPTGTTNYQVIGMLGQGTFAQVFKCKNLDTGQLCALKIVKNKPAYTRQAAIEIEIFIALSKETTKDGMGGGIQAHNKESDHEHAEDYMVSLLSYFLHQSHLCLVFELLGLNLYELLKRRQFRGLPIHVVRDLIKEAIHGTNHLTKKNIVHCDLKPENILVVSDDYVEKMLHGKSGVNDESKKSVPMDSYYGRNVDKNVDMSHNIKLIDFGSACFEGQATHTYIQSRFYRSPEVLIGLDYDSAIDMWSLGCVAAELFLGLPILPGIHEHDQIGRICEMIGKIPDWMVEQGKKSKKYFVLEETKPRNAKLNILQAKEFTTCSWRLKTRDEFIKSLSEEEKKRCGGQSKLEQPSANRYFKKKLLEDIVLLHGNCSTAAEKESLQLFVHFLKGILHPDPCERWTAFQASSHPFITGRTFRSRNADEINMSSNKVKITDGIYWSIPWDASVPIRKLSFKQNQKSGRSNLHKSLEFHREDEQSQKIDNRAPHLVSPTSKVTDMAGSLSISMDRYHEEQTPPAPMNLRASFHPQPQTVYQTPSNSYQLSSSMMNETNPTHYAQTQSSLSMSLHTPRNLNLDPPPPVDVQIIADHMVIPTMPVTLGAQSFSGVFHDGGGVTHALQGDFGYALQRPGVVPTSAGVGHLAQMPMNQQMYVQPQPPPPPPPQQPQFLNPSSYHSQTADINHYAMSAGSYTGGSLPNHLIGPLSPPQNPHHMTLSFEQVPQDVGYPYIGTGQMRQSAPYPPNLHNYAGGRGHSRRRSYEDREFY